MTAVQTSLLDDEIVQLEVELESLETELNDLNSGIYHMSLDNGMTLEVGVTGEELQVDEAAIRAALGMNQATPDTVETSLWQQYLPYILIGGGGLLLLVMAAIGVRLMTEQPAPAEATVIVEPPTATPVPTTTPTITPTPSPSPTPTPPLIPAGFIGRAPAQLQVPSLRFTQPVYKGDWAIDQGQVTLGDGGSQVRYFDSFVGENNTVIGGDASTSESPMYPLRGADVNDVVILSDRAGRTFYFRLLPFGGDRVERYITPDEIWVIRPTDRPALTLILRVDGNQRLVLRGALYKTELE